MRTLFFLASLILSLLLFAQPTKEKLTNASIISLHKAGLGKEVLLTKINSSDCVFVMSTENMVQLKKASVPDEVIAAMVTKESVPAKDSTVGDGQIMNIFAHLSSGIYYQDSAGKLSELEPSVFSQSKQGSGILTAMTYGIAKTKQKSTLSGALANLQISQAKPTFYFVFEKNGKGNLTNTPIWFASASSPNEFILVKLTLASNKKSREVVTGSYNSYEGLNAGIDDTQKMPFTFAKTSQGVYKISFQAPLQRGEYCFVYAGSASTYGAAPVYKVFDFGVNN